MKTILSGQAHVFGKNIDTDQIYPGRFVELTQAKDIACHAMEGADPEFANKFNRGDIVVASTNFGCGSSREHAAITLKEIGVGVVVAESFGRIFYRNAINIGLPVLICSLVSQQVKQGNELKVDIETGLIQNLTAGSDIQAQPLTGYPLEILSHGGIKSLMKQTLCKT